MNLSSRIFRAVMRAGGSIERDALYAEVRATTPADRLAVDKTVTRLRTLGTFAPARTYRATEREGTPDQPQLATLLRRIRSAPHAFADLAGVVRRPVQTLARQVAELRAAGWVASHRAVSIGWGPKPAGRRWSHATRADVLAAVAEEPASSTEIGDACGVSAGLAYHHLRVLEARGLVVREGQGNRTRWRRREAA
jgi:DNA-binding transcriptional ArsR family regulator